ncbi:hypothetical protein LKW31_06625 [Pantoea agglomerans]|uniref:hypothetical protein n=1 Tax=Enterobacter agglomerans TaxID=549 RepID=UPI001E4902B6|nr:hypothetical protein [Pantoea agglomerans]UEG75618.1 hypothetical protein LKW31_06625 [Pantoea agglomerans]
MSENSLNSIHSIFSEVVKQYSNPQLKNEKGQNLIFRDYVWNIKDLEHLTKNGFNINSIDNFGKTPIFYCKDKIQFRLLLLYGADHQHVDNQGKNLLFYTNETKNVELMLKFDINTSISDNQNRSFLSYELFHTTPHIFSEQLASTKIREVEVFQIYENTHHCLNLLNNHKIKIHIPKKVHLHFDPLSNPVPFENFRSGLTKATIHQDTKFTFYSNDSNICTIYSLKYLDRAISSKG